MSGLDQAYKLLVSGALAVLLGLDVCAHTTLPGSSLQAGIEKEEVDGNLSAAMEIYRRLAAEKSVSREIRAKALLRLASCYEKLGRQATPIYQQILREFPDQAAAAQARLRLASLKQAQNSASASMTLRKIEWSSLGVMNSSQTDGNQAIYQDASGNLLFGDLAGHSKRFVYKRRLGDELDWMPSRDFSLLAICVRPKKGPSTLLIAKTDGTGYRELLRDDIRGLRFDWSWDNRYLVLTSMVETRELVSGDRISILSIGTGQRTQIANIPGAHCPKATFSRDDRFLAYEVQPTAYTGGTSRIFVVPVQGGHAREIYASVPRTVWFGWGTFLDWTADGRYLAVADLYQGKGALYLLPMKDGTAAGSPKFVRYANFAGGQVTAAGSLVYQDQSAKPYPGSDVWLGSIDAEGNLKSWHHLDIRGQAPPGFNPWPSFSPDGKRIAYRVYDMDPAAGKDLDVLDLDTGQDRLLYRSASDLGWCQYAIHQFKIFCTEEKAVGTTDVLVISDQTGEPQHLASFRDRLSILWPRQDDQNVFFTKFINGLGAEQLVEWRVGSPPVTIQLPCDNRYYCVASGDGRWMISTTQEQVSICPTQGGEKRIVATANEYIGPFTTTPDGRWILYHDTDTKGKHGLFRVPILGGSPQWIGDFPSERYTGSLHMSADGRQLLAVTCDNNKYDLWILDNFVPPQT